MLKRIAALILTTALLAAGPIARAQTTLRIPSGINVRIEGDLEVVGTQPTLARSRLVQESLAVYPVQWTTFRVWDAFATNLPGTSSADDLALVGGTFGTGVPSLESSDLKAAGATTLYARFTKALPAEYVAGETVQIRISGGMVTTVADTSATVDVEAYESDREGAVDGSDLVTTSATTINSLTFGDDDFTVTATALAPGDVLDVRITVSVNDGASGTEVKARLGAVELLCDIKG